MQRTVRYSLLALLPLLVGTGPAWADKYDDTIAVFRGAGESGEFFGNSYGYALFPNVGKGGIGIGGQHDAATAGAYHKGMAIFTVAKGGLLYEASVGGQKSSYKPR